MFKSVSIKCVFLVWHCYPAYGTSWLTSFNWCLAELLSYRCGLLVGFVMILARVDKEKTDQGSYSHLSNTYLRFSMAPILDIYEWRWNHLTMFFYEFFVKKTRPMLHEFQHKK